MTKRTFALLLILLLCSFSLCATALPQPGIIKPTPSPDPTTEPPTPEPTPSPTPTPEPPTPEPTPSPTPTPEPPTPEPTPSPTPTPEPPTSETTSILDNVIESEVPLFCFQSQSEIPISNSPVFTAPYDNAYRMSNGKETLQTNIKIEDCGVIDETLKTNPEIKSDDSGYFCWLLVRYVTDSGETRIGNVPLSPEQCYFREFNDFVFLPMTATETIYVTNNPSLPFFSEIYPGDNFYILGRFSEYSNWLYIECDYHGKKTRGFITNDSSRFQLVDYHDVDVKILLLDEDNGDQYKTITVSLPMGCLDIKRHLPHELYFNDIRYVSGAHSPLPVSIDRDGNMSVSNFFAEYYRCY